MAVKFFYVSESKVWCSGQESSSHPLVYLNLLKDGKVTCPYCSATFVYVEDDEDNRI